MLLLADRVPMPRILNIPKLTFTRDKGEVSSAGTHLDQALYPKPAQKLDRSRFGGSRCQSYHAGTQLFEAELRAAKIRRKEQEALIGGSFHYLFDLR